MSTSEKISAARNEIADALYLVDTMLAPGGDVTSLEVAIARRKLSCAIPKLVSAESELSLLEERNRK